MSVRLSRQNLIRRTSAEFGVSRQNSAPTDRRKSPSPRWRTQLRARRAGLRGPVWPRRHCEDASPRGFPTFHGRARSWQNRTAEKSPEAAPKKAEKRRLPPKIAEFSRFWPIVADWERKKYPPNFADRRFSPGLPEKALFEDSPGPRCQKKNLRKKSSTTVWLIFQKKPF